MYRRDDIEYTLRNENYQSLIKNIKNNKEIKIDTSFIDRKKNIFYFNEKGNSSFFNIAQIEEIEEELLSLKDPFIIKHYCPNCNRPLNTEIDIRHYILYSVCLSCYEKENFSKRTQLGNTQETITSEKKFSPTYIEEVYGENIPLYVLDELGNYFEYKKS